MEDAPLADPANSAKDAGTFIFLSNIRDIMTGRARSGSRFALSVLFVRRAGIKRNPRIKRTFSRYIELLAYARSLYFHAVEYTVAHE